MCDTIVALGSATRDRVVLFGKNSDREPDGVQNITIYPRRQHLYIYTASCRNCAGRAVPALLDVRRGDGSQ